MLTYNGSCLYGTVSAISLQKPYIPSIFETAGACSDIFGEKKNSWSESIVENTLLSKNPCIQKEFRRIKSMTSKTIEPIYLESFILSLSNQKLAIIKIMRLRAKKWIEIEEQRVNAIASLSIDFLFKPDSKNAKR